MGRVVRQGSSHDLWCQRIANRDDQLGATWPLDPGAGRSSPGQRFSCGGRLLGSVVDPAELSIRESVLPVQRTRRGARNLDRGRAVGTSCRHGLVVRSSGARPAAARPRHLESPQACILKGAVACDNAVSPSARGMTAMGPPAVRRTDNIRTAEPGHGVLEGRPVRTRGGADTPLSVLLEGIAGGRRVSVRASRQRSTGPSSASRSAAPRSPRRPDYVRCGSGECG